MNEKLQMLLQLLRLGGASGAPQQGQTNVSAPNAAATIRARQAYNGYAQDSMINGEEPLPFEQWVQQQGGMR